MPAQSRTYRKAFRWRELNGLPVAAVTALNGRLWCWCCPACGCLHELIGGEIGKPFAPDCLLRKLAVMPNRPGIHAGANWARVLADWYSLYPAAAGADTVMLMSAQDVAALDTAARLADRRAQRSAADRAKRAAAGRTRGRPRKEIAA